MYLKYIKIIFEYIGMDFHVMEFESVSKHWLGYIWTAGIH